MWEGRAACRTAARCGLGVPASSRGFGKIGAAAARVAATGGIDERSATWTGVGSAAASCGCAGSAAWAVSGWAGTMGSGANSARLALWITTVDSEAS